MLLVVIVSAVSNFKQNRQFQALANESSDIRVVSCERLAGAGVCQSLMLLLVKLFV